LVIQIACLLSGGWQKDRKRQSISFKAKNESAPPEEGESFSNEKIMKNRDANT
jgi:hypothetical protein